MSWLRNSQIRNSFTNKNSTSPPKDCDPVACTESFKKHWQQANEIIERTQPPGNFPIHDDVLGVVNHLGQMVTLLVVELRQTQRLEPNATPTPCLEHLLSENTLEKLLDWSVHTGRFSNSVKSEQLKLYELLVSHAGQELLVHNSFLRPLLKLLSSCTGEVFPLELEKRLVLLLNQLCISIMHNIQLLDLFFYAPSAHAPAEFVLFSLLIPFVHREEPIGQQARDALLLCMSMSKKNDLVGSYIAEYSNVCPVLATGLSGLYSLLPRKLDIETDDWHRLTPDDINELPELTLFINSFEFCNAVAQVAHESVKEQLLEFIYHGFLVPVMGPALLQEFSQAAVDGTLLTPLQVSTVEELVAATAYYELFIRNATNPELVQTLTRFLMQDCYDGQKILNTLITRISSTSRLCQVTLSLFEALLNLDCEEVVRELVLRHLVPCNHVMLSQKRRLREVDPFSPSSLRLLSLAPAACSRTPPPVLSVHSGTSLPYGLRAGESLYGNYHAYLCDARARIESCSRNCKKWTFPYDGESPKCAIVDCDTDKVDSMVSAGDSSGYESFAMRGSAESTPENEPEDEKKPPSRPGPSYLDGFIATPDIGPFLDALLKTLERMPSLSLYVNLRLTAVISRLALYPQPLISSLLLNHSLVFQPSIRSLFQVLGSLKQKLDALLGRTHGLDDMVRQARTFLLQREERLANMRKTAVEAPVALRRTSLDIFSRGDSKRSSLSSALSYVLRRAMPSTSTPAIEHLVENQVPGSGYRYVKRSSKDLSNVTDVRNAVMCAVLLDEWLKELAAIAQEQTLFALSVPTPLQT